MFGTLKSVALKRSLTANFAVALNLAKNDKNRVSLPLAKIVATIGPASENLPVLPSVVEAGMRIMRINFSHATYDEANLRVTNLKKCAGVNHQSESNGHINMRSILLDTQGPEIRTGSFGNGVKEVEMSIGQEITMTTDESVRNNQSKDVVWLSYRKLYDTVQKGSSILLDDGAIEVQVVSKSMEANGECSIVCTVINSGTLGNKKGVNMPGLAVDLPAMSDKDKQDIRWGVQNDIDYIAASFTRKPSDVHEIRSYTESLMKEFYPSTHQHYALPRIISKIESTEALENFDEILAVSDGIMVARGDLAVEIPMETLAVVQKEIVRKSALAGKPCIVATQMLESMQKNPRPTRAECTDVANALLDGADAVMLSGESAKGKYPVGSISMMNKIIQHTEHAYKHTSALSLPQSESGKTYNDLQSVEGIAAATVQAADRIKDLKYIIVNLNDDCDTYTHKHSACSVVEKVAGQISKFRPQVPILVTVRNHKFGRLLQMYRGLHPIVMPISGASAIATSQVMEKLKSLNIAQSNDEVLIVTHSVDGKLSMQSGTV